ncbi:MAG: hypothetical protein KF891_03765 [Rhizobacter sp.]|nr:hypothetical protein [Rhizobacter sp.]
MTDPTFSIDEIYQRLTRGLGHELVNDDNVSALIERAERDRHTVLAQELREWQAPCVADERPRPSTIAPTAGFNREHVKH